MNQIIRDTARLADFCQKLASAEYVTVDTEFMRDKTYWPVLCLVQLGGPDEAYAVDPLADGMDLQPLFHLLNDEPVLKVFHAARQDIEIFVNLTGKVPAPIFDTQIAAMACGLGDSASYESLVTRLTTARIDKLSRFSDWAARPLTDRQIDYAISDVVHLRPVYEALRQKLDETGREEWLSEEQAILTNPETYRQDPESAWLRIKSRSTDVKYLQVLKALAAWREREAQRRDLPRNRVLRDDALGELAAARPASVKELARTRSFSQNQAEGRHGQAVLAVVAEALAAPRSEWPKRHKNAGNHVQRPAFVELLRVLLKIRCEEYGVAQKLIANSEDLDKIALNDKADVPALKGWRREVFGDDALALKAGRLALTARDGDIAVVGAGDGPG